MITSLYDCFKHWSQNGRVMLFSDPHFNDENSIKFSNRWLSAEDMLANINTTCHKNDTLLLLGDVGDPEYLKRIKAKVVLLAGNHDNVGQYKEYVAELYTGPLWIAEKILISHEPVIGLPYVMNIHGHDHAGRMRWTDSMGAKHLNVASNVLPGWKPIDLGSMIKEGLISHVPSIHRMTIDNATVRSVQKKNRIARKNGEPEIVYQKPRKKVKEPVVQQKKDPNDKLRELCEKYCLNCSKTRMTNTEGLLHGQCEHFEHKYYMIIDKTNENPVKKIIQYHEGMNKPECAGNERVIMCPNCPSMFAALQSLTTKK